MSTEQEQREGKLLDLKPELTTTMKLAASFAITYYGLLFIFAVITVIFRRYYIDSFYFNEGAENEGTSEYVIQIIQLALLVLLIFSLIQIFRKKNYGKALFVGASLLIINFQLITTGFVPWMKYAVEVLLILIIAPVRIKKKVRIKKGKLEVEDIEGPRPEELIEEHPERLPEEQVKLSEASSQPAEQP